MVGGYVGFTAEIPGPSRDSPEDVQEDLVTQNM